MHDTTLTVAPAPEQPTVRSLGKWGVDVLLSSGFDEARLHVELLLGHALSLTRTQLEIQRDRRISREEDERFRSLLARRLGNEPLQYVIGETEFMGLTMTVDPGVLIPRPETELLAEKAIELIRQRAGHHPRILDIGTGSGCIAITLGCRFPDSAIFGLDVSPDALRVAAHNIRRHRVTNVSLVRGDIFEDVLPGMMFELLVANPPYVSEDEFRSLQPEVRDFEPRSATTDGSDGLRFARRIADFARERLMPGGSLLMEIGYGQGEAVTGIVRDTGMVDVALLDDFAGIPRVVIGVKPPVVSAQG